MRKYKKASWESNGSEESGEGGSRGREGRLQSDVLHERRIKKNVKKKKTKT